MERVLKIETKDETGVIGEKGHGTKVYFNSKKIEVITAKNGIKYHAIMNEPKKNFFNHVIPTVDVTSENNEDVGNCETRDARSQS